MSEEKTKLQKYSAPALEKGLDILEFLSLSDVFPTLSQLAQGIGRSKNEIFRMMIVLEERGYIERQEGDLFRLTGKLALLGGDRTDNSKLAELAEPYMERLAEETELSNHLWVPSGSGDLVVINSVSSSQNYGVTVQVGYNSPIFPTSAGACFLSELESEKARLELLEKLAPSNDVGHLKDFADQAAECNAQNYISLSSPESQAINEISAPVRHAPGKAVIAALTIPHFATALIDNRREMVIDALRSTAAQLQESIATRMPLPRSSWHQMI
ncbi:MULTISPECIES: helix-turn-helix domain-containing protein [unclassified Ruegeria]|uniref:IclR family transcriptional regulator n=1 Tax=unclassified Ruegeria TaxID=2625375 RepID=UPI001ADB2095|nr:MULTISPECIES: helix-turn-helix domain-containing protein [unclassified Ruegeria]MBO9413605.1 helix-turn-helix domain-containing protein [Ruegeria sp. R8_1]MBO9417591.1 helix-turn-helix domain-containing protein [Ruegeria sp. R8_2]